jgi:hypothetical protein
MVPRNSSAYHAEWSEPPEPRKERREAERYTVTLKLSVSTDDAPNGSVLVAPATVRNISRVGVLVETKQRLQSGQQVTLAIPTGQCPDGMRMPEAFVGPATAMRVIEAEHRCQWAGLRFGDAFLQNMEFGMFIEFLQSTALTEWLLEQ